MGVALATLIALFKQSLGTAVSDICSTARLTASPACRSPRIMVSTARLNACSREQNATGVTATAPVLEVNPEHPLIAALAETAKAGGAAATIGDAAHLLLDQARILEGEVLPRIRPDSPIASSRSMRRAIA